MLIGSHGAVPMGQMCKDGIICRPCRCLAKKVEKGRFFSSNTWPCLIAAANYRQGTSFQYKC